MMASRALSAGILALFVVLGIAGATTPVWAQDDGADDGPALITDIPENADDPRFDATDLLNPAQPGVGFCLLGFFCELDPTKVAAVSFGYKIATFVFSFLGFAMVLIMLYGGFLMLTSFGNAEGMKKGKDAAVAAVIGFILLTFAYVAVRAVIAITK